MGAEKVGHSAVGVNREAKVVLSGKPFEEGEKRGWGEGVWVEVD